MQRLFKHTYPSPPPNHCSLITEPWPDTIHYHSCPNRQLWPNIGRKSACLNKLRMGAVQRGLGVQVGTRLHMFERLKRIRLHAKKHSPRLNL